MTEWTDDADATVRSGRCEGCNSYVDKHGHFYQLGHVVQLLLVNQVLVCMAWYFQVSDNVLA